MVIFSLPAIYPCLIQITEQSAVWMIGDYHLQHMIPKFICNKARYPELAVFEHFEYHFDQQMRLHQVPGNFAEMLNIYTHVPQALVIMVGGNDLGIATKAQTRARVEDMLTDLIGLWGKCKPAKTNRLGLFVSLVPLKLWYWGFVQQKAGREARRSLNSHLGKVAKQLGAIVIPHPLILAEEKWYSDPRHDASHLSEPGYDILIQDVCVTLTTRMQFSEDMEQREVALSYFHGQAQIQTSPKTSLKKQQQGKQHRRKRAQRRSNNKRW